jgi:hypothetical protein
MCAAASHSGAASRDVGSGRVRMRIDATPETIGSGSSWSRKHELDQVVDLAR